MSAEEKLFAKISEEIKKQFESIGDQTVKDAAEKAFSMYEESYKEQSEKGIKAIEAKIEDINKQFEGLDDTQTKELATQLGKVEETLLGFEDKLKKIGEEVTKRKMGTGGSANNSFSEGIEAFLSKKLPTEEGRIIFEAMEGMSLSSQAIGDAGNIKETNSKVAVLSAASMFALPDMTNPNSVTGQAIPRDLDAMGFRNIPPILNDHIADIFTTPTLKRSTFMTIRIFHTYVDGVDIKVEGTGTFAKSSVQLKSQDYKVFTYGTQYRMSVEEFEDVPEMTAELNSVIPDRMMNDLDEKILTDSGDNSAAPWGAFSTNATRPNVTLFDPYLYAGSNPSADVADVVAKMKLQVRSQNYRVNAVLAHDNFYDNYEGLRDADGNSLMDRRVQFNSTGEIIGMAGLATRKTRVMNELAIFVTATNSQILGIRENVMMQVGLNDDDFATHNISTKFWGRYAYGSKDALANIYTADFEEAISILSMDAATALDYTKQVALGTAGFDQANITISLLKTAGCINLVDANETAYQVAIEAELDIANLAALQAVIDTVNAA
jgi:hypothetical protein